MTLGAWLGLASLIVAVLGIVGARVRRNRRYALHTKQVSAHIDWGTVDRAGPNGERLVDGAYVNIVNASEWPVTDVIAEDPEWLGKLDVGRLGPGQRKQLPIRRTTVHRDYLDCPITLQVKDDRGWIWHNTPERVALTV